MADKDLQTPVPTPTHALTTDGTANGSTLGFSTIAELEAVITAFQQVLSEGAFVDGDKTKLDGVEASADVTDTTNVTAAGALMDSELTDLVGVKGVTISTLQLKPVEGAFVDGDKTKLDGIEASADITDTANVTSAGALMDSEVTNLADVKAFDTTDYATAAQGATADTALQNTVEDTTPQLGGNLDANGNTITGLDASVTASGIIEVATAAETDTGTDAARAVSPDGLAGSAYGTAVVTIQIFDDGTDVATGDGAGDTLWRVPSTLNGFDLVAANAYHQTAGTTGTTTVMVHNLTQAADMLSTAITISTGDLDSADGGSSAAGVIDTLNDDVATADKIRIDVDGVTTTAPKGLWVELQFRLP